MIEIDLENLAKIAPEHGVSKTEILEHGEKIGPFLKNIERLNQGFYKVIDDDRSIAAIKNFAKNNASAFSRIVVLGIGGSALGAICIRDSLSHLFKDSKLIVLDNIDPVIFREADEILDLKKTLFIVVTKSGSTPETVTQFFYYKKRCEEAGLNIRDHFVVITDPKNNLLRTIAEKESLPLFDVPETTGGRFSVLTSVGLLPALMIGIDPDKLIEGAKKLRDLFMLEDPEKNLPFMLAAIQFILYGKGKTINVMTPYAQKLLRLADWYRQLLAESIGKRTDRDGNTVNVGITPVNGLGATDQHSQNQLYNEGPNDKLHIFIKVRNLADPVTIPNPYPENPGLGYLNNITFNRLIETEMEGTVQALTQNGRPNLAISVDRIDEETLGGLFMLFEGATAFLGEFFNINAFDQPGVELSKQITKQLLLKKQ